MMRYGRLTLMLAPALVTACAGNPDRQTLAQLRDVPADVKDVQVQDSLDQAMQSYRRFLEETPVGAMTPEAMRRLADLHIEKEFGIRGTGDIVEMPAPDPALTPIDASGALEARSDTPASDAFAESEEDFERRATGQLDFASAVEPLDSAHPGTPSVAPSGPLEAIEIYKQLLAEYPSYEHNDQVLYQMARAYDELGQTDDAMQVMDRFITEYGYSRYIDEVQFRRGEYFFTRKKYRDAEDAYSAIIALGPSSQYRELALYKLGWTLYKQEFYEEALHQYMALLDYKLSIGYDFDQEHDEDEERRVADTFRVISLSFSNLGGPEVLEEYYSAYGNRSYEDRIYSNLGEFYLEKLRYQDAASVYESFVELNPFHRVAPHFSMRTVEIYAQGGFPLLVVESKKQFATDYGLQAEYWNHFDINESPEVVSYLKTNLKDLANHYHALYQDQSLEEEKPANYGEAQVWYRQYLASFPQDADTPPINYQLADLLLENGDYGQAATEYERTAYDYPLHEQASAAGYAAIYAHREHLKVTDEWQQTEVKRATVASSLRFAETFPDHEHAPVVLGAAAEDLYAMKDFEAATVSAQILIERYPAADVALRHSAWTVVAHSSFELAKYQEAEQAYTRVLELTPEDDDSRQGFVDNLAASIYKQGEQANLAQDYRAAADHFLRIRDVAPTSEVRAAAEYDAAAALMRLEDWTTAASVLEAFRRTHPDHELQPEATRQLAFVYREAGQTSLAAAEYVRVADESQDPELRREALLVAGELYEEAGGAENALGIYVRYLDEFPRPLDIAVETRFKVAGMYEAKGDLTQYHDQLREIVAVDETAGVERTDRIRYLAAQSALVLSELLYQQFADVRLVQPFEQSLATKQRRMDAAIAAFEGLVDYEVAEVTAAATFYMAEIYYGFGRSLLESERPSDLDPAELADYELVIEEEAFPFEEQAIEVHEKNLELMVGGIFNDWIEKSLGRLADLMPGRYAKHETSSGFIVSIESFTYREPNAPDPSAAAPDGQDASPAGEPTAEIGAQEPALDVDHGQEAVTAEVTNARTR